MLRYLLFAFLRQLRKVLDAFIMKYACLSYSCGFYYSVESSTLHERTSSILGTPLIQVSKYSFLFFAHCIEICLHLQLIGITWVATNCKQIQPNGIKNTHKWVHKYLDICELLVCCISISPETSKNQNRNTEKCETKKKQNTNLYTYTFPRTSDVFG